MTVTGYSRDATHLKEIHLTEGKVDYRVETLEQSNLAVHLKAPARIPAGQMRFAILIESRPEG